MSRLKVTTILGTRPEIIRLSSVMARLDAYCEHRIVHTGQNWDYELNEVFFQDLQVRKPDRFLGIDTSSLGAVLGGILIETEKELREHRPDAVLILGDTNSAISALIARRMKIPVYHMEAGNRSFDRNVPEETNRRMVDHIADFNLVYTEHARRHLLSEGIAHRRIYLTGSPMAEVLNRFRAQIAASDILVRLELKPRGYFLASLHREENVDNSERLRKLIEALNLLVSRHDVPVVISTHPRTRKRLEALADVALDPRLRFLAPFGFLDYNRLQLDALCVISDSGTIAEESSIMGFPAITPRDAIERPEAMDTGAIMQSRLEPEDIAAAVDAAMAIFNESSGDANTDFRLPADYAITNTSDRVLKLILGTARLSNQWDGIRIHDYV